MQHQQHGRKLPLVENPPPTYAPRGLLVGLLCLSIAAAGCSPGSTTQQASTLQVISPAQQQADAPAAAPSLPAATAVFAPLAAPVPTARFSPDPTATPSPPPTAAPTPAPTATNVPAPTATNVPTTVPPAAVPPTEAPEAPSPVPAPTEAAQISTVAASDPLLVTSAERTATPFPDAPEFGELPSVDVRTEPTAEPAERFVAVQNREAFATIGALTFYLPSERVERVGLHQAGHTGALGLTSLDTAAEKMLLPTRSRGTDRRGAADIVVEPGTVITAPVSGVVLSANTYTLYCEHTDSIVVIEPDGHPSWETKILHISDLRVTPGQRVEAGMTVIAGRATILPFESQIDEFTAAPAWPHVHIETIDTNIPDERVSGSC